MVMVGMVGMVVSKHCPFARSDQMDAAGIPAAFFALMGQHTRRVCHRTGNICRLSLNTSGFRIRPRLTISTWSGTSRITPNSCGQLSLL